MPGYTPILGIPYPLVGETIDPTIFASFANVVDAAIAANQVSAAFELNGKPTFRARFTSGSFGPGTTTLTFSTTNPPLIDNNSFFNAGTPTRCTFNTAGVYLLTLQSTWLAGASTATRWYADFIINGVTGTALTVATQHPVSVNESDINLPFMWRFNAGDYIEVRFSWTGTGTGFIFSTSLFSAMYVCALS